MDGAASTRPTDLGAHHLAPQLSAVATHATRRRQAAAQHRQQGTPTQHTPRRVSTRANSNVERDRGTHSALRVTEQAGRRTHGTHLEPSVPDPAASKRIATDLTNGARSDHLYTGAKRNRCKYRDIVSPHLSPSCQPTRLASVRQATERRER